MVAFRGFFNTIILLGSIQGFIVSSLLFFYKRGRPSNRILSGLILLMALASFNLYGNYANWFGSNILRFISQIVPLVVPMAFGPLMYFYVRSLLAPGTMITKRERLHFLPVVIDFVPSVTAILFVALVLLSVIPNRPGPWGKFIDNYNVYADIPRWISISAYVWMSGRYLKTYRTLHHDESRGREVNFNWLRQFVRVFVIFQAIWLVYLVPYVLPRYTDWMLRTFDWYPIYIPLAILVYWLGIKSFIVSQAQMGSDKKKPANPAVLSPDVIKGVLASLTQKMQEEQVYLDPHLNLALMAQHTGFSQKTISGVLNQHMQKNFNEFVNGYRVEAFKEKIVRPEADHLTIAGVAAECGFSSPATFQRTFKEMTGQSPSEFRRTSAQPH